MYDTPTKETVVLVVIDSEGYVYIYILYIYRIRNIINVIYINIVHILHDILHVYNEIYYIF